MGTWKYLWHFIFLFFLCIEITMASTEETTKQNSTPQKHVKDSMSGKQDSTNYMATQSSNTIMTELNAKMPLSPFDTSLATDSTMTIVVREETEPTTPAPEEKSHVSVTSKVTNPFFTTTKPDATATGVGTASGSSASLSLRPSSPATSHSSSSPVTGQATAEASDASSSMGSTLPAVFTNSVSSHATNPPGESEYPVTYQGRSTTAEPNPNTSLSFPGTLQVTPSMTRIAGGDRTTETVPTKSSLEDSSLGVSVGSEMMNPNFPTTRPDAPATGMGTASGSAASVSLRPSSLTTSYSSSSPVVFSADTPSPQRSSTSVNTEEGLANTSKESTTFISSPPSSTPGVTSIESGAESSETVTHSPASSIPSSKPSDSATSMLPTSDTTEANLLSTLASSAETQAEWLTSAPLTLGQATAEASDASSSTESPLPAVPSGPAVSHATTPPRESENPITNQGSSTTAEPNPNTSLSLPDTSQVTSSTTRIAGGDRTTETPPSMPTLEDSSLGVSVGSETMNPTFPTTRPDVTATDVGTASGSAASISLRPSSPATSHFSSSPLGSSAATPSPQQSSTSGTTEAGLTNTLHPSTTLRSFNPSSTPAFTSIGLGPVTAETAMNSPAPSMPSPKPSTSTAGTSPTTNTTKASLLSTMASGAETQAEWLTSTSLTSGQATAEVRPNSTSTRSPLSATSTTSAASCATTPPRESEIPITNQGSRTTAEPSAKTLPHTSLVTESMTDFRKSTSVSPSFTVNCLPVSIDVQNVTGETIQFSWTGGSGGSLYNVSLMDGNQEINRMTTKETKTVFEHLIPGQVYRISVALLPCAESSWTSVTVRTDPVSCFNRTEFCLPQNTVCPDTVCPHNQAFACTVLFKSQTFNNTLYNSDSDDYIAMSERIRSEIVKEMSIKRPDDHFDIVVLGFRPGSVIAYFISLLQREEPIDVNVIQIQLNEVFKSKFGGETEVTVQWLPTQSSTGTSNSWKVAVIVLGVLLGVALVLLLLVTLLYIYMKKRSVWLLEERC